MVKHHPRLSVLLCCMVLLACIWVWAGDGSAKDAAETFPANIIYVPTYHSRPLFLKSFRPEPVSPVKKISVNEPRIAEVKIISPYELVIDARYPGSTMFMVWYEDHSVDFFEVRVTSPRPAPSPQIGVIRGTELSHYGEMEW